jgi:hypothetical protein
MMQLVHKAIYTRCTRASKLLGCEKRNVGQITILICCDGLTIGNNIIIIVIGNNKMSLFVIVIIYCRLDVFLLRS